MRFLASAGLAIILAAGLSACGDEESAELPPPAPLTQEAIGYYCNMTVTEHHGPKGQIRLKSEGQPVWFSSVRDTIAFTLLPEEPKDILVVYVTDMSRAETWENPESGDWIEAKTALFVIGSTRNGGMGAPEPVPFSSQEAAEKFADQYGGEIVGLSDIPDDAILGPVEIGNNHQNMEHDG
jgi:copper chaperone NosL